MLRAFSRLFKKGGHALGASAPRTLTSTPQASASLSRVERFFLSNFDEPTNPAAASSYLRAVVQQDTVAVANRLLLAGLIEEAPELRSLLASTKMPDLKQALKDAGLKVSGKKEELAQRLLANRPDAGRELISGSYFILTDEGRSHVRAFRDEEDRVDERFTTEWLRRFDEGDLKGLLAAHRAYSSWQIKPPDSFNPMAITLPDDRILEMLEAIREAKPVILGSIAEPHLSYLRRCASWNFAGGGRGGSNRFPPPSDFTCALEAPVAIRMVSFAAKHNVDMASYRRIGIKKVKISACGSGSCSHCMKFDGKIFALARAPELPHPECTHEMGCRCYAAADFDGIL